MAEANQDIIKKILIIAIFAALIIAAYLIVRPFLAAILAAAIFSYVLTPIYKKINSKLNKPSISSFLVCMAVIIVFVAFLVFLTEIVMGQVVNFYTYSKATDILSPIKILFNKLSPTGTFPPQVSALFDQAIDKSTTSIINYITLEIANIPLLVLQIFVFFFVLFYFLRDMPFLVNYFQDVLPFSKKIREHFFSRFKSITESIVYGTIFIGALNGLVVSIGLYIFHAPNPFILSIIAVLFGILPVLGTGLVWISASIYMILNGNYANAIGLAIYCGALAGILFNVLVVKFVSTRSKLANAVALVGMLGGLKLFGIIGLLIGPLILDYTILFIEFYRKKEMQKLIV